MHVHMYVHRRVLTGACSMGDQGHCTAGLVGGLLMVLILLGIVGNSGNGMLHLRESVGDN